MASLRLYAAAGAALMLAGGCVNEAKTSYDLDGGDLVVVGKAFLDQRNCQSCHQPADSSQGTLSGQSTAQPGTQAFGANLTPDHATGIGDWADLEIARAIRFGVDKEGQSLCPPMPHYADANEPMVGEPITDVEMNAIIAYLRSLPAVARPDIPESTCPPIKPAPPADLSPPSPMDMATSD